MMNEPSFLRLADFERRLCRFLEVLLSALLLMGACACLACGYHGTGAEEPVVGEGSTPQPRKEDVLRETHQVELGSSIEIVAGAHHDYPLDLQPASFVRFLVRQQGVDVALRFSGPGIEEDIVCDSPTGPNGSEELVALTPQGGQYLLSVEVVDGNRGHYRIDLADVRPDPDEQDLRYVAAHDTFHRAKRLRKEGQYAEALSTLQPLIAEWRALGSPLRETWTHEEIAKSLLAIGRPSEALSQFEQVIAASRQLGERRLYANNLFMASGLDLEAGRADRALRRLEEVIPLFQELAHQRGLLGAWAKIGIGLLYQGRGDEAMEALERALSLAGDRDRASVLNDLGTAALTLHRAQEALGYFEEAAAAARERGDSEELLNALNGTGRAAARLGALDRAKNTVQEALEEGKTLAADFELRALLSLGMVQRLDHDLKAATSTFEKALLLAEKQNRRQLQAQALINLGFLELASEHPARGLECYQGALDLYDQSGQQSGQASASAGAAEALQALGRRPEAWERLEEALRKIEELRSHVGRSDHRLSFFAFRQDYFDIARRLILQGAANQDLTESELNRAFELEEQRRSRELLEIVTRGARESADFDEEDLAREKDLEAQIRLAVARGGLGHAEQLVEEMYALRASMEKREPKSWPTLSLDSVRQDILDDESLLVIVGLGEEEGILWAIDRSSVEVRPLPPRRNLERLARLVISEASRPTPMSESGAKAASRLAQLILEPIRDQLAEHRRLVVVAEGELQNLPFSILPLESREDDSKYLIESHEIVALPSVSLLDFQRKSESSVGRGARPTRFAIFADAIYGPKDPRLSRLEPGAEGTADRGNNTLDRSLESLTSGSELVRLTGSRLEAESILTLAGDGDHLLALGFEAASQRFRDLDFAPFTHLHVATHALLHEEPELSGLVFSRYSPKGEVAPDLGFVAEFDISRRRLPLELVVLSACETGISEKTLRG